MNIPISKRTAMQFVVLLGIVSLLGDMTYEGARGVTGPYLALLGASATVVGMVAGFGELIGLSLRLVFGYLSDRTGRYWTMTLLGYALNLLAVPLLALAGHWEVAALLMITERLGKAIRTPARDAMLSYATKEIGRGWGFGLHEAMDQIGAVLGPLVVAAVLYVRGEYRAGFGVLLIPALLAVAVLVTARLLYPHPRALEIATPELKTQGFSTIFWLYLTGVALIAAGYADFPLIAYHFGQLSVMPQPWIPVLYAVAMGVDALAALVFGRWFDKKGLVILVLAALLSSFFAPLVFSGGFYAALAGMALWGIGMGAQESVMRAAVGGLVSPERRGTAYGLFNSGYGLAWFLGSLAMGILYDRSLPALIIFSVVMQLAAVPLFLWIGKRT
ncbi:MAG: MFS transporter [Gemmataceae bacterium]